MLPLPDALLEQVVAFVPCRDTRAALGFSYEKCITLRIAPCPLAVQPTFRAHLERLLPFRQNGWGIHVLYPERRTSVWLTFELDEDRERLLTTVTTCIGFDGPGRLRQSLCGEVRDLHVMFDDENAAPRSVLVHRSTRHAGFDALYGPEWGSAPWFNPKYSENWFVQLDDLNEIMSLKDYCAINQV